MTDDALLRNRGWEGTLGPGREAATGRAGSRKLKQKVAPRGRGDQKYSIARARARDR